MVTMQFFVQNLRYILILAACFHLICFDIWIVYLLIYLCCAVFYRLCLFLRQSVEIGASIVRCSILYCMQLFAELSFIYIMTLNFILFNCLRILFMLCLNLCFRNEMLQMRAMYGDWVSIGTSCDFFNLVYKSESAFK